MSQVGVRRPAMLVALGAALVALAVAAILFLQPRPTADVVLNVGDQRGSTRALLAAAGELEHTPYKIVWSTFPVGAPLVEAIKAGAVDFGYVGSSTMTFGLISGSPLKAISVWRFHGPGSGILVRPNGPIRTVADLRGQRIAVVRGSPAHLLVARVLETAGIPPDAVKMVFLLPGDAKAALSSGSIDAWAIWDPYLAIGEKEDHLSVLIDSEGVTDEVECGVASEAAVKNKRAQLLDFIGRVRRAYRWADTHPDAMARSYAAETGLPLDIAKLVRGRMKVEVLPRVTDAAIASHQKGADLFVRIGVIPSRVDIAKVYDRSFGLDSGS